MAKASKLRILYCEGDADEQEATAKTFEQAGHIVEKAVGRKAVEAALKKGAFELIVLGPTLSRNDRHHLPYMAKKVQAQASVLVMHADGSEGDSRREIVLDPTVSFLSFGKAAYQPPFTSSWRTLGTLQ